MNHRLKRYIGLLLVWALCFTAAGCGLFDSLPKEKEPYFGTAVSQWNPLVIYAEEGGERYFARDPSLISMVVTLFDEMELEEAEDAPAQGVRFSIATMRGRVELGRSDGKSVWRCGQRYTIEKDVETELQRLFGLIRAETEGVTQVTEAQLLAVTPDMTYGELLEHLGKTLQTAVVGAENAFLYQYDGEPFYITFEREDDPVKVDGSRLIQDIGKEYHLTGLLTQPEPLPGGRGKAYEAAFRLYARQAGLSLDDCRAEVALPYTDEEEQGALSALFAGGEGAPMLRVEAYYYMAEEEMWLQLSAGTAEEARDIRLTKADGAWSAALLV